MLEYWIDLRTLCSPNTWNILKCWTLTSLMVDKSSGWLSPKRPEHVSLRECFPVLLFDWYSMGVLPIRTIYLECVDQNTVILCTCTLLRSPRVNLNSRRATSKCVCVWLCMHMQVHSVCKCRCTRKCGCTCLVYYARMYFKSMCLQTWRNVHNKCLVSSRIWYPSGSWFISSFVD